MAEIGINGLIKRYGEFVAVDNFDLAVEDGEFVSLLGPSGCGKTTLLRSIAGFFRIDDGEITIGDRVVSSPSKGIFIPPEQRNLGMVFQSYAVWPHMNVFDNIAYPLKVRKMPAAAIAEQVGRVVEMLNLADQEKKNPAELSGGQQQRVALGRALVMEPDVLLLDEPLSNLDAKLRDRMRFELKEVQLRFNQTIIYVTHDQDEAMAVSDRIVLVNEGKIQQIAEPREIFHRPKNLFSARFIGRSNFLSGTVQSIEGEKCSILFEGTEKAIPISPANESDITEGMSVEAVIRYENVSIASAESEEKIEGVIEAATYLGGTMLYEIRTAVGMVFSEVDDSVDLAHGATVGVALQRVHLFPRG